MMSIHEILQASVNRAMKDTQVCSGFSMTYFVHDHVDRELDAGNKASGDRQLACCSS